MPNDKVIISQYILNDIANAIKTKTGMGEQEKIKPINMANTISSISAELHLPITVNIAQSEHQTITVTPVNVNNGSVSGTTVTPPTTVTLNAAIVADQGYNAGTLNQTSVTANWGDTVSFSATPATELIFGHCIITPGLYEDYFYSNPSDPWGSVDGNRNVYGYFDTDNTSYLAFPNSTGGNIEYSGTVPINLTAFITTEAEDNKIDVEAESNSSATYPYYISIYYTKKYDDENTIYVYRENINIQSDVFVGSSATNPLSFSTINNQPLPFDIDKEEDIYIISQFFVVFSSNTIVKQEVETYLDSISEP